MAIVTDEIVWPGEMAKPLKGKPENSFVSFSLLLKDLISDFYLTSLQLVLCRVAAVKRLPVHQP